VSGDISPKTRDFYQTGLQHFTTWAHQALQREPIIGDLNPDYVGAFKTYITMQPTDKHPEGSIFRARAAIRSLKRLASWLADEGTYVGRDGQSAIRKIKMPKEPKDVRQPLSDDQLEEVRHSAGTPSYRDYTMVVVAAGTGLRRNELRLLKVGSVDLMNRRLKVLADTSKVRRPRWVDFHDSVARDIDR
jgi:integrase